MHFLDLAGLELSKQYRDVSTNKLQSLLELALKTSAVVGDPHGDAVSCALERTFRSTIDWHLLSISATGGSDPTKTFLKQRKQTLACKGMRLLRADCLPMDFAAKWQGKNEKMLTGYDLFLLDYKVDWPLSLVLTRKVIADMQLVFRYLLHCKLVEQALCRAWQQLSSLRAGSHSTTAITIKARPLHCLCALPLPTTEKRLDCRWEQARYTCQQLLHFMQNILYYFTAEVIEPNWARLEDELRRAETVDDYMQSVSGVVLHPKSAPFLDNER